MKSAINFLILSALIVSCQKGDDLAAKNEKLKELRKEEASISSQIKSLEKEIALAGGNINTKKLIPVDTSVIHFGPFAHSVQFFGTVESDNNVEVHPETSGSIESIKVSKGAKVSQGQTLAVIDNKVIRQNIREVQTSLDLAKTLLEKQERLWEQKVGTELQLIEAQNRKESLEKKLGTLNSQLSMSIVKAPISGIVDDIFQNQGEMANPAAPLFRVINSQAAEVEAQISESYLGKVKKGDLVKVEMTSLNKTVNGKITSVSEYINPANRTFKISVDVGKAGKELKPNMLTRILLFDYKTDKAIVIPNEVIQYDQKGNYVYVISKNSKEPIANKIYIETDQTSAEGTIVKQGLQPGDVLVVKGQRALTNGEKVSIKTGK